MIKKLLKYFGLFLFLTIATLIIIYFSGPVAQFEKVDNQPYSRQFTFNEVANYVAHKEAKIKNIKPDNESQFIWQDSLNKTAYSLIYLHGFSASHGEAHPILDNFSDRYNCNTYLPRLHLHGLNDEDAFVNITPKDWVNSGKEAIAIAKAIGEKVIVMSTSTGSTIATYLAANDPDIEALIMTSPNIDLYDQNSQLLVKPWGKQIFRQMIGSDYRQWEANETINKYWTTKNRIEAHVALRDLLNQTMTPNIFEQIKQPVYIGYYYANEDKKDKIISIDAIDEFGKTILTPEDKIVIQAFDNARGHVISSSYMNNAWEDVQSSIFNFFDEVILN